MARPQFLCIGAQKAGTSWLYENLMQHPGVWMPPVKELHYFDHLFVPANRRWTHGHLRRGAANSARWHVTKAPQFDFEYIRYLLDIADRDVFSAAWYERLFDRQGARGKLLGDITPEYSTIPDAGIRYLREFLGAPKIIYIIRHPVGRAISQLRMNVDRSGHTPQNLDEWIQAADSPEIFNRGDYRAYVPRWRAHFAAEDLLFMPYSRIRKEPAAFMREIEDFLQIPHFDGYSDLNQAIHETKKIDIPAEVKAHIEKSMAPQVDFLRAEFGADFEPA